MEAKQYPPLPWEIARRLYGESLRLSGKSKRTAHSAGLALDRFGGFVRHECRPALGDVNLLTVGDLRLYIAQRYDRGLSVNTRRQEISLLRSFFRWLRLEGLIREDPMGRIESPKAGKPLPRALDPESSARLLAAPDAATPAGRRDRAILELFFACGPRVSELAGLDEGDLDPRNGTLHIRHGKGDKDRLIPVGAYFLAAWKAYELDRLQFRRQPDPTAPLFYSERGTRFSVGSIGKMVVEMSRRAGLRFRVTPHMLRHTMATDLLEQGLDLMVIKTILGHESIASTQIYTQVSRHRIRESVRYIDGARTRLLASNSQATGDAEEAVTVELLDRKPRLEEDAAEFRKAAGRFLHRIHREPILPGAPPKKNLDRARRGVAGYSKKNI